MAKISGNVFRCIELIWEGGVRALWGGGGEGCGAKKEEEEDLRKSLLTLYIHGIYSKL